LVAVQVDQLGVEDLDGDLPLEAQVGGEEDAREAAPPDHAIEPVAPVEGAAFSDHGIAPTRPAVRPARAILCRQPLVSRRALRLSRSMGFSADAARAAVPVTAQLDENSRLGTPRAADGGPAWHGPARRA
jgi:hypothetical protein